MSELLQGVSFPGVGTGSAVTAEQPFQKSVFNVTEQVALSVATFRSLGFSIDQSEATEAFTEKLQGLHDALTAEPPTADVEPFIGITLTEDFGIQALKAAFDTKQTVGTYCYAPLWDQYSSRELNSRSTTIANKPATPTNSVQGRALAMLHGNHPTEPGLYFTNRRLTSENGQVETTKRAETAYADTHNQTELLVVNSADYIILNAQRREQDLPLLDQTAYTRFIQLAMKTAGGSSLLPGAHSYDDQLELRGSYDYASSYDGVRLLVGQKS